jgi:glutamine amidotransferase
MQSVALIDYGSGNLRSAEKALRRAAGDSASIVVTADPAVVAKAERIVLPGVGAFASCMAALRERDGLIEAMGEAVRRGAPFLGVCVGMQLLATRGLEFGQTPGLGWIAGDVVRMAPADPALKIPHMGWNAVETARPHPLFEDEPAGVEMYFTHSFALQPADGADVVARADHGGAFVAAVARGNIAGVQFHPEKSQGAGLRLLANFLEWRP